MEADVLVLGGGIAGCMAAIAAARKGQSVILVEK
ncbi:MAG: FAD-dependent oxidoreductase, partial [Emergencia timonensis]